MVTNICVRLNHDVKEDVEPLQDKQILDAMGMDVYLGIRWLTGPDDSDPKLKKLSRAVRNHVYHHQLQYAPYEWKLVKLDDRADNLEDAIEGHDDFYKTTYVDETGDLLEALRAGPEGTKGLLIRELSSYELELDPVYEKLAKLVRARTQPCAGSKTLGCDARVHVNHPTGFCQECVEADTN
jgi:hypothetical protein